jgi:translation initiation factor IF-3
MSSITPDPKKRSYLLPPGCKNLADVLGVCREPSAPSAAPLVRVNGKIRAQQVQVVGKRGRKFGVMLLSEALMLAKSNGFDLVEIAPLAKPPICRLVDFGMFRYEQAKRRKVKK